MNHETYTRFRRLIGQKTVDRSNIIDEQLRAIGFPPKVYELASPRGTDRHLTVQLDFGQPTELWFTANYDTFENFPSGNNNASGVVTLLGLIEEMKKMKLPINVRVVFFDAGLDNELITKHKRNPDFIPGSKDFLKHLIDQETEFIDTYQGAVVVQAVGKGNMQVYEKTGKKIVNSTRLNRILINHGKATGNPIDLTPQSPNADNLSFLEQGLEATVLARYHEGAWHKMQTPGDDMSNVNVQTVDQTIQFLVSLVGSFPKDNK